MLLELPDCFFKLVKQLVLHFLVRPDVLLHVESVLESTLNDEHCVLVVLVDSQFLIYEIVGFSLLGIEFGGKRE